ncbi:PREDICTED: uncharacterized protein LOC107351632 [Acropora digitifera]|uniref:uncharacterized protein LOC107351632 n=1 Tax=Acropora digitifera TaxID=70779 RepID=UPI00077A0701|nr:PREDICTED: uncharacterized protein LOC107351632 [Acropora digitifera]
MEAQEKMIRDMRRWLTEADKLASEVTKRQLARLDTSERVLRHLRPQNRTDAHNETYQEICGILLDNIVLRTRAALISKETDNMSQEKSAPSEILPIVGEIKGYLKELESKNNEIDRVMNQIEEMLEMRDYELTEKETVKVKKLLLGVEAKLKQAEIYVEAAEKALMSLSSEVDSYQKEQGVSGWKVFVAGAAGAVVGAGAASLFIPPLAPAIALSVGEVVAGGAIGGGAIGGIGGFLHGKKVNKALLFGASVGLSVPGLMLCLQLKRWYATRNFCNRLCSIIQNYSDKVDEMNCLLNSTRMYVTDISCFNEEALSLH